ncbi:hypothetical protein ACFXKF_36580 [Streptomyces scopuliridis]|uniref:hypothetical protein n=1 Tax=Streptomyces scopuliridis TaxID=452529 RepID=UPI0036784FCE
MPELVELLPVIVTSRPLADNVTGVPYQQPPEGTDPGALRIVRAGDVRDYDWYLGDCEQPTAARRGIYWGVHITSSWPAKVRKLLRRPKSVALDGVNFHWRRDELVMIIPREFLPAGDDDWMGGSFIWEPGDLDRDGAFG